MSRQWLAAGALAAAIFTLVCMLLAMRLAGPMTHSYKLGTLQFRIDPSFSGKAQIYVPLAGWEMEAPIISAPYTIHAEPRRVSPTQLRHAVKGFRKTIATTKKQLKRAAIWTFVRAFLFALLGGLVAGLLVGLVLQALRRSRRELIVAAAGCFALSVLLVAGSGLWIWQSLDIGAFKRSRIELGHGPSLTEARAELGKDKNPRGFIQDFARLIARGEHVRIHIKLNR